MIGTNGGNKKGRPKGTKNKPRPRPPISKLPDDEQKTLVKEKLTDHLGSMSLAAQDLQMTYATLYAYVQREPEIKEFLEDLQRSNWEKIDEIIKRKSHEQDKDFIKMVLQYQRKMAPLGYSKEPEIIINNQVNFRFELDDFQENNPEDAENN